MGAASAGVPAIMVTGGPCAPAHFRGRELGVGTDIWHYTDDVRAGRMTLDEYDQLEAAVIPSYGHCSEMGTASTMSCLAETLGMTLPGTATIPAVDARRQHAAEASGRRAVELATAGPRPAEVLTSAAFDNAITVLMALGGSTNAVVHLLALARRVGIDLPLDRFGELSRRTPVLANVRPSGEYLFEHLDRAGGVPALLQELAPLLDLDVQTVAGGTLGDRLTAVVNRDEAVLRPFGEPLSPTGGIAVLRAASHPTARSSSAAPRRPASSVTAGPPSSSRTSTTSRRGSTIPRSPSTATACSCCGTPAPRVGPGCPSGASCRSRNDSCAAAWTTSSASRMPA